MATQSLKHQIERIQTTLDAMKPKPTATVIHEPGPDADPEAVAHYQAQLAQARHSKHGLVVIAAPRPVGQPMREQVAGVKFVESEWEATLVKLAGQPSEHGGKNGLDDFLKSLSGNVLGTVANPPPDIHQRSARRDL